MFELLKSLVKNTVLPISLWNRP